MASKRDTVLVSASVTTFVLWVVAVVVTEGFASDSWLWISAPPVAGSSSSHSTTMGGWETSAIAEVGVGFGCTVSVDVFCEWTVVRLVREASCTRRKGRVRNGSRMGSLDPHQPAFAENMIVEFVKSVLLLLV